MFVQLGILLLILSVLIHALSGFIYTAFSFLIVAAIMVWGSRIGKIRLRDRVLNKISWTGDARVLDVGCGRGLMLLSAAKHLTTGKAVGIDIWQVQDQSGNSPDMTWANARAEGVADKIEIQNADARQMPFPDGSFDIVLSSWALHNIYDAAGRAQAVREIARVLKPGGQVALVDIRHTGQYASVLRDCGFEQISRSSPNFLFVIPTYTLIATKNS